MQTYLITLTIAGTALSFNPTLPAVAAYRQTNPVIYAIPKTTDIDGYECLLGVPLFSPSPDRPAGLVPGR